LVAADATPPVTHPGATALLAGNRPLLVVMFVAGVVVGAILLATEVEHVSPGRAVRLEREGVRDPTRSSPSCWRATPARGRSLSAFLRRSHTRLMCAPEGGRHASRRS
jgi:hypothetical protein